MTAHERRAVSLAQGEAAGFTDAAAAAALHSRPEAAAHEPPMLGGSKRVNRSDSSSSCSSRAARSLKEVVHGSLAKESTRPQRGSRQKSKVSAALKAAQDERAAKQLAAIAKKVAPFGGLCWWCYCPCTGEHGHDPDHCSERVAANVDDLLARTPATRGELAAAKSKRGRSYRRSTMTSEEVRALKLKRDAARGVRQRALDKAAKERTREHVSACMAEAERQQAQQAQQALPLPGNGPLEQYTFYEKVVFEFVLRLSEHMTAAQLARPPGTIDASARQLFSQLVNGRDRRGQRRGRGRRRRRRRARRRRRDRGEHERRREGGAAQAARRAAQRESLL